MAKILWRRKLRYRQNGIAISKIHYGEIKRGRAYPFGLYNKKVTDVLEKCYIAYSRTTDIEIYDHVKFYERLRTSYNKR